MIHFPDLTLKNRTYQLKELTIGQSIAIASRPSHLEEANATAMIRMIASHSGDGSAVDPLSMTVELRLAIMAHYMACTLDDGPDFAMGDGATYSDYVDFSLGADSEQGVVDLGEVAGDKWKIEPMTGLMVESVERLQGQIANLSGRAHWMIGTMAAQLFRDGEAVPTDPNGMDSWITHRASVLAAYPDSDFSQLIMQWAQGRAKQRYLYQIEFSSDGIVVAPREGGEASALARFPVSTAISPVARLLV